MMKEPLFQDHGWTVTLESALLPDGRTKTAARVHRCDSVHLLAFPEPEKVLLLREFRPFYGDYVWMLPSGKVDKETDIDAAAQRELREETGFRAEELVHYGSSSASESINIRNHVYLARGLVADPLPQDETELIEVHALDPEEALDRVLGGEHVHAVSALALLRFLRDRSRGVFHTSSTAG